MTEVQEQSQSKETPLEALILECPKDKYKYSYAALRWAKEIKQKENLPDPIAKLLPRALRELLEGKVTLAQVEDLPIAVKVAQAPPAAAPQPTISLNVAPETAPEPVAVEPKAIKLKEEPAEVKAEPTTETKEEPAAETKKEPEAETKEEEKTEEEPPKE